ncbi:MAG: type II secretion system F family protein [Chloroflexi bacterium]|nr:type II secretion system F family protein [Chloroflexota bacterium]
MAIFKYTAQTRDGKIITSTIDAVNLNLALDTLMASRLKVLEIKKVRFDPFGWLGGLSRVSLQSIVLLTRRLGTMLRSGLPLARALQVLYDQETDRKLKPVVMTVLHDIRIGATLSWALAKHPTVFSNLFISMVKVGEATGDLAVMLEKLADFLERDLRVRKQAASALTYPAFVFAVSLVLVLVIFLYILPTIMEIFSGMATIKLPLPTQIMFFIIETVKNPYVQLAVVIGVLYYAIYFRDYIKTPEGKFRFDKFKLKAPLFGNLNRKLIIAQFCRALGVLLGTGIPLMRSLEILMEFMDNSYFKQVVCEPLYDEIKTGKSVSQAFEDVGFFPLMASNMVAVGESTGEMPAMLNKVSAFYDMEVLYALEAFLAMLEPIMIGAMGVMVCFILLSVFMPLYQFIMNLGI